MVIIEELYPVLDRGTECFSLSGSIRMDWGRLGEKLSIPQ